jgi:hypothetical protein
MSSNNVRHLITRTITTLQHFVTRHHTSPNYTSLHLLTLHFPSFTLHHTSPNYTSLHLLTLHFLSFTLHYPLIWLNPLAFPTVLFHLTSLNYTQYSSPISKLISKIMNPFTPLKESLTISLHFTSLHFLFFFFFNLSYQPFTSLYFAIRIYNSLHFTSLHFTSLHFFTFC